MSSASSNMKGMEELRAELVKVKELEEALATAKWNQGGTSPRGVLDAETGAAAAEDSSSSPLQQSTTTNNNTSLIQRYQQARDLYLQRRLENLIVDHIGTYDPEAAEGEGDSNNIPMFEEPDIENMEENDAALEEEHAQALASLQTCVDSIETKATLLRDQYQVVRSRRMEMEQILKDMEEEQEKQTNNDSDQVQDMDIGDDDEEDNVSEEDMAREQARIEQLQQTKRQLQEKLARLEEETKRTQDRIHNSQEKLLLLQPSPVVTSSGGDTEDSNTSGGGNQTTDVKQQHQELKSKVRELQEMKVFYDSLREVMEELGGVKILDVRDVEAPLSTTTGRQHPYLDLTVKLYDQFDVRIRMETHRRTALKLVHAQWLTEPVLWAMDATHEKTAAQGDSTNKEEFSLSMEPLDDLVQVAKTTLAPPHDVRFIIRESLARIRIIQHWVNDLSALRRQVLTKIVVPNKSKNNSSAGGQQHQVICTLNEGIVIVMRLYEQWVRVEQVVGVGGWKPDVTQQIQDRLAELMENQASSATPSWVVAQVQTHLEELQKAGMEIPQTPRLPLRASESFFPSKKTEKLDS